jgi:uncharacterized membrane protein (UPF0127 family)
MMNFNIIFYKLTYIIINICVLCFFGFNCSQENITAKNNFCDIYIINNQNNKIKLKVEIADTVETQTKGLMFRDKLDENSGMIFVFGNETTREFWMMNTYIPLNIAYINRLGIINEIYYMRPLDTSIRYPSQQPAMYALEVNKDWFKKNNIFEGSKVIFNGCFGK